MGVEVEKPDAHFVEYTSELLKAFEADRELPVDVAGLIYALQNVTADAAIQFFLTHGIKINLTLVRCSSVHKLT